MTADQCAKAHSAALAEFDPAPYLRKIARPHVLPGKRVPNRTLLIDEKGSEHELTCGSADRHFAHAVHLAHGTGFVQFGQIQNRRGGPDHELRVWVDGQADRVALRDLGGDGNWYSQGWTSDRDGVCFSYMGNEAPFLRNSELSLFLGKNGLRPENVAWAAVDLSPPLVDEHVRAWWDG